MAYTTIDDPSAYFQTKLYTGNSSTQSITFDGNTNMQPDWVWIKSRSATEWHQVHDSVRGVAKYLFPNTNSVENERSPNDQVTSFNSNGFSLGAGANDSVNTNSGSYVSWNWKAGTSFTNDASATGIGSIDSSGSASDTAGFSIVSYTGTGSNGTVKHGLTSAPKHIIIKRRDSAEQFINYHHTIGNTGGVYLNLNNAAVDNNTWFNDTSPTSTVFSIGTNGKSNASSATYIAYCFAEKKGYSKFSSYKGNNQTGNNAPFIYTGFKPAWLMVKKYSDTNHWIIWDNKRSTKNGFNIIDKKLYANLSNAENGADDVSFLSNGFKFNTNTGDWNEVQDYIYMCFAESPFVTGASGIPTTAR